MQIRLNIHRCVLTAWLLAISFVAHAYTQVAQPAAWRTTPTLSSDNVPEYQFRSTSVYTPMVGATSYTATYSPAASLPSRPRKEGYWDENGDWVEDPEGQLPVGVIDTPVGEPMILLLMALLYIMGCVIYRLKRNGSTD